MRVPEVLLARINAVAGDERTKWILEACRMRLDGESVPERLNGSGVIARMSEQSGVMGSNPITSPSKPDMAALREICEGNLPDKWAEPMTAGQIERMIPDPVCVVCESPMRKVKGKWACPDMSCGKYGVEQKPRW